MDKATLLVVLCAVSLASSAAAQDPLLLIFGGEPQPEFGATVPQNGFIFANNGAEDCVISAEGVEVARLSFLAFPDRNMKRVSLASLSPGQYTYQLTGPGGELIGEPTPFNLVGELDETPPVFAAEPSVRFRAGATGFTSFLRIPRADDDFVVVSYGTSDLSGPGSFLPAIGRFPPTGTRSEFVLPGERFDRDVIAIDVAGNETRVEIRLEVPPLPEEPEAPAVGCAQGGPAAPLLLSLLLWGRARRSPRQLGGRPDAG